MRIDLKKLQHAVNLAEKGSFSKAAEVSAISQPAFSRSIAAIEAAYGVQLFHRSPTGITPTKVGAAFVAEARRLLIQSQTLEHNLSLRAQGRAGNVAFGIGPMLASMVLPRLFAGLAYDSPGLAVHAVTKSGPELVDELKAGGIEFCLMSDQTSADFDGVDVHVVGEMPMGVFCRTGHPLTQITDLTADQMNQYPVCSGWSDEFDNLRFERPAITCENFHILAEAMMLSDALVIATPEFFYHNMAKDDVILLTNNIMGQGPVHTRTMTYSISNRDLSPAAKRLLDRCCNILEWRCPI